MGATAAAHWPNLGRQCGSRPEIALRHRTWSAVWRARAGRREAAPAGVAPPPRPSHTPASRLGAPRRTPACPSPPPIQAASPPAGPRWTMATSRPRPRARRRAWPGASATTRAGVMEGGRRGGGPGRRCRDAACRKARHPTSPFFPLASPAAPPTTRATQRPPRPTLRPRRRWTTWRCRRGRGRRSRQPRRATMQGPRARMRSW
jgi:hypothetical protein